MKLGSFLVLSSAPSAVALGDLGIDESLDKG